MHERLLEAHRCGLQHRAQPLFMQMQGYHEVADEFGCNGPIGRAPHGIQTAAHADQRAKSALRAPQTELVAPVRRTTLAGRVPTRGLVNQGARGTSHRRIGEIRGERIERLRCDPGRSIREDGDLARRALHGYILAGCFAPSALDANQPNAAWIVGLYNIIGTV